MSTNEDTLRSLGHLLDEGQGERDAVHIAVIPVVTGDSGMRPGQRVALDDRGRACATDGDGVGIIDPFLPALRIGDGERCWLYLTPGSITSLRHDWTHPAFPVADLSVPEATKQASELWLRTFADDHRVDYSDLVNAAESGDTSDATFGDDNTQDARSPTFWQHVENVTGKRFDQSHRENTYFSCSC